MTYIDEPESLDSIKSKSNPIKRMLSSGWVKFNQLPVNTRLAVDLLLIILVFLTLVVITPSLRYKILNRFSSAAFSVTVVDETNQQPLLNAKVSIGGLTSKTNEDGTAEIEGILYGEQELEISKPGFESYITNYVINTNDISHDNVSLFSNGKRHFITTNQYLSGAGVDKFIVTPKDNPDQAAIGVDGVAELVVESDTVVEIPATITANNFLEKTVNLDLRSNKENNSFELIPDGKHYFLANRNGTTSIYSSLLDGSNQSRVIEPTGSESSNAQLYVTPGARFALYIASRRNEGDKQQLYRVRLDTGDVSEFDSGAESWEVVSINDTYVVYRKNINKPEDPKNNQLKKFVFETEQTEELISSRDIRYAASIDGVTVMAEMIERGSYPGGYLLRQVIAVDERTLEQTVLSEDVTINGVKVVAPTKIQYEIVNPRTSANVKFVYDTAQRKVFQASIDRTKKHIISSPESGGYAWTVDQDGQTILRLGDIETKPEKSYEYSGKFTIRQWVDERYVLLGGSDGRAGSKGLLVSIKGGQEGQLP